MTDPKATAAIGIGSSAMKSDDKSGLAKRIFGLPSTRAGRVAVYWCTAFFALFGSWLFYTLYLNPIARPTFFSDPVHVALILSAAASGIMGACFAAFAFIVLREKSVLTSFSFLIGSLVLVWTIAEMTGQ